MKKFNKLLKIISMTLTVCMLVSICSVSVVFADDERILADHTYDYYTTIDTTADTPKNSYGIYMDDKHTNLEYQTTSFTYSGTSTMTFKPIAWPPVLKTEQNATLKKVGSDYIVRSNSSKVKYRMPARVVPTYKASNVMDGYSYESAEAMIIDYQRAWSGGVGKMFSGNVEIGKSYEKIHFLVGVVQTPGKSTLGNIQAHVVYADDTTTLPEDLGAKKSNVSWANAPKYKYPDELIDAPESDGRNGYICEMLPGAAAANQSNADNFVADFVSYTWNSGRVPNSKSINLSQFRKDESVNHAAYEYTLTLDPTKVVKHIVFSQTYGMGGFEVLAVSGENPKEDWTDKIVEINDAITNLETKGAEAPASEVAQTMEMVSSAEEAGDAVKERVDIDKFYNLFKNPELTGNLVDATLAGVDLENITWDDTTDNFKNLDDVASVIEGTGNLETCPAKQDLLDAYEGMVESLINEEEKDNDKLIERFELLKSAKTPSFQTMFDNMIIYSTEDPSMSTEVEHVTFEVAFSKPVNQTMLTADNFEVLYGKEKIDNSWISVEPIFTDSNITGAKVSVLNSQKYAELYTLNVSKDLKGANNESWAYQLTSQSSPSAPFTVSVSNIELKADRTFKGKVTLNNSLSSATPCIVLISSYDADGIYLGTIPVQNGTAAKGTSNIEFTNRLPEGAKEVICYVYDSVTSMALLTPPLAIVIPSL